jgi:hypothetical protein
MPERLLGKIELEDIAWGSTLLGSGGGGSIRKGLRLIAQIENKVTLLDPADLPESANAVSVGGIGAPRAMAPEVTKKKAVDSAILAYEVMKNVTAIGGVSIDYLMPGEIGGYNTILPIYVAAKKGVPVVDADGNGRAVPELATGLQPIYNIPASPLVVTNNAGDIIVAYLGDPLDATAAENIARTAAVSFGMRASFCTWVVSIATLKKCLVTNSISRAERIGRTIREAKAGGRDVVKEVIAITDGKELFRGRIRKIEMRTEEGFDFGRTTIEGMDDDKGKAFVIDSKNENMIAWQDEKPVAMVPDLITMITTEGEPLNNADTKEGMELAIIGIHAPEPWMRTPDGFHNWKHILDKLGYQGSYISSF